jgi:hypothetical protein
MSWWEARPIARSRIFPRSWQIVTIRPIGRESHQINPPQRVIPNIRIGVESTPQPNRITADVPPNLGIVIPIPVVEEPALGIEITALGVFVVRGGSFFLQISG